MKRRLWTRGFAASMHQLAAAYPHSIALRQLTGRAMVLFCVSDELRANPEIIFSQRTLKPTGKAIRAIRVGGPNRSEPDG
jgi:hypothetical protein